MTVAFELPPAVHNSPQFSRLRRSPSPHPRAIPVAPKSNFKKTIEAVRNHFKISREAIKHQPLSRPRQSESFPRQYTNYEPSTLRTSMVGHGVGCRDQVGLRLENHQDSLSDNYSSEDDNYDEANDSGVDVSEDMVYLLQEKLWVVGSSAVGKDGGGMCLVEDVKASTVQY